MQREISAFTLLFEVLKENNRTSNVVVSDTLPDLDQLPYIDGIDENKMLQMEEVRKAYVTAVSTAKENQDEESVVLAAKMRLRLQSLVLGPQHASSNERVHGFSALPVDMIVS
ncbi:protein MICROTUBULE BINDING PROTEIN 2C-like [Papaver somniferum]|uniref:protein MICROTUBULE BINDING PROTEIN 2C-like n=1 Tax=Papaver somniferum TaxID=3469 RepID=UPI000E6FE9F4|nr:protein MICROTUBULE BINDING PROTEIN 2C-like [Papaver somniferum]